MNPAITAKNWRCAFSTACLASACEVGQAEIRQPHAPSEGPSPASSHRECCPMAPSHECISRMEHGLGSGCRLAKRGAGGCRGRSSIALATLTSCCHATMLLCYYLATILLAKTPWAVHARGFACSLPSSAIGAGTQAAYGPTPALTPPLLRVAGCEIACPSYCCCTPASTSTCLVWQRPEGMRCSPDSSRVGRWHPAGWGWRTHA